MGKQESRSQVCWKSKLFSGESWPVEELSRIFRIDHFPWGYLPPGSSSVFTVHAYTGWGRTYWKLYCDLIMTLCRLRKIIWYARREKGWNNRSKELPGTRNWKENMVLALLSPSEPVSRNLISHPYLSCLADAAQGTGKSFNEAVRNHMLGLDRPPSPHNGTIWSCPAKWESFKYGGAEKKNSFRCGILPCVLSCRKKR